MKRSTVPPQPPRSSRTSERQDREGLQKKLPEIAELYRRAEARVRAQNRGRRAIPIVAKSEADPQRMLHELQVHQVELEMQNNELQDARDRMELLLEKFTDLYDFAPVGYLSLDEHGQILEVNLSGAALLRVGRARLVNRRLPGFVIPASRGIFLAFLKRVFAGAGKQVCEVTLQREDGTTFWADFHGTAAISAKSPRKWCRVVVSDITVLKRAEEAQRRADAIEVANEELRQEITRRKVIEESLRKSEQHQRQLFDESRHMQEQLRHLSRQILTAQEEERKRISRELHDVIAQTLTGINLRLSTLKKSIGAGRKGFGRNITLTQKLVEKSVNLVHDFARELRPAVLDDLGLIPALHTFMKGFTAQTGVRTQLTAFAGVEQLDTARRTVLFRVAQEALTNVAKHAHASRVEVNIQKLANCISMKIKDDGKSFSAARALQGNGGNRLGLLGMRERVEMVGGNFAVESSPGKGTTVATQLPFGKAARRGGGEESLMNPLKSHLRSI